MIKYLSRKWHSCSVAELRFKSEPTFQTLTTNYFLEWELTWLTKIPSKNKKKSVCFGPYIRHEDICIYFCCCVSWFFSYLITLDFACCGQQPFLWPIYISKTIAIEWYWERSSHQYSVDSDTTLPNASAWEGGMAVLVDWAYGEYQSGLGTHRLFFPFISFSFFLLFLIFFLLYTWELIRSSLYLRGSMPRGNGSVWVGWNQSESLEEV